MLSYNKDEFLNNSQDMGIHDLRTFARSMGVQSPTTKKRNELIDAIVSIMDGLTEAKRNNMGRPVKAVKYDSINDMYKNSYNNVFSYNADEISISKNDLDDFKGTLNHYAASPYAKDNSTIEVSGIIKRTKDGTYFFKNLEDYIFDGFVLISDTLINENLLNEYYFIRGFASRIPGKNFAMLELVTLINGSEIVSSIKGIKTLHKNILPLKNIEYINLKEGSANIEEYKSKSDLINTYVERLLKSPKNYYFADLSLNLDNLSRLQISQTNASLSLSTNINDSYQATINILNDFYNHIKLMYDSGKKVILNLLDITWFISTIYEFEGNSKLEALKILEKFMNLSACDSDGASVTVISYFVNDDDFKDEIKKLKHFCS